MENHASDIAFTRKVKTIQERLGSREVYGRVAEFSGWETKVTPELERFLAERDSFYLGSATADGQPYIQHRGGPRGFLKVLDERTLAFADFVGNRQYLSMGNFAENDKAFIFLMDYANRRRIKVWGRVEVVEDDPVLLERVSDRDYAAQPERVFLFHVKTWDRNCPQHIPQLVPAGEVQKLEDRIAELEDELERREQ
jgi:hypothetical protein